MTEIPQPSVNKPLPPWLLESVTEDPVAKILEAIKADEEHTDKAKILCKQCSHTITDPDEITIINDRFIHTFTNPSGLQFDIQCYRSAPGALVSGKPTEFFSWFSGYTWQFCYCRKCSSHIGWYYAKQDDQFFGLNVTTLRGNL